MNLLEMMRQLLPEGLERDAAADRFLLLHMKKRPEEKWGLVFSHKWRELWEIKDIQPGSPASGTKLQVGDLICSVNGQPLKDMRIARKAFQESRLSIVAFRLTEVPNLVRWPDLLESLGKKRVLEEAEKEEVQEVEVRTRSRKKKMHVPDNDEFQPHPRACCSKFPYVPCHYALQHADGAQYVVTRMTNEEYCEECYCSLCSVPANVCSKWSWHCQISLQKDEMRAAEHLTRRLAAFPNVVPLVE